MKNIKLEIKFSSNVSSKSSNLLIVSHTHTCKMDCGKWYKRARLKLSGWALSSTTHSTTPFVRLHFWHLPPSKSADVIKMPFPQGTSKRGFLTEKGIQSSKEHEYKCKAMICRHTRGGKCTHTHNSYTLSASNEKWILFNKKLKKAFFCCCFRHSSDIFKGRRVTRWL